MSWKPAEAILALGWKTRASLYFDLTDKAVGGLVRLLSRRLQPRVHRLALRGRMQIDALVDPSQRLPTNELF